MNGEVSAHAALEQRAKIQHFHGQLSQSAVKQDAQV
jgi:hypothetical protein